LLVGLTLVLGLLGGAAGTGAAPAQAIVSAGVPVTVSNRAVAYTASKKGAPYQYGAVGPSRFDCSGLTKWAYARAGRTLPRTVALQYATTLRVSHARPGDLVFFMSGGRSNHMGIYAGAGKVWHAPRTGGVVSLSTIWTSAVIYRRVR